MALQGHNSIMIDFVKLRINSQTFSRSLLSNDLLTFRDLFNQQGQKTGKTATFHGITFAVYPSGMVEVSGSLHQFWNSYTVGAELQNWNDFHRLDLFDAIHDLTTLFGLDPSAARVHNIEFGVNIALPSRFTALDILQRFLVYGTKKFNEKHIRGRGYFVEAELKDFFVKAYDKGTQFGLLFQMVRFEKKVVRMKNTPNLTILSDLTKPDILETLGESLVDTFDTCLIAEPLNMDSLRRVDLKTVQRVYDVNHWQALTDQQRYRLRGRYGRIASAHNSSVRLLVRSLVVEKWQQLLQKSDPENSEVLRKGIRVRTLSVPDGSVSGFTPLSIVVKPDTQIDQPDPDQRHSEQPLPTDAIRTKDRPAVGRLCRTCAKPLTGRQQRWCSQKCKNDDLNPGNNPRNGFKRKYLKPYSIGPTLFNISNTERLTEQQQQYLTFRYRRGRSEQ